MSLKIVRRGKRGIFQIVGTVAGCHIRKSTGLESERHAEAERIKLETRLLDEATYGKRHTATFYEAVDLYRVKGGSRRFAGPLVKHFGARRLTDIRDLDVANFATLYYPTATPATLNRQVYTPLIAIWRQANAAGLCGPHEFTRPKKGKTVAVTFATDEDLAILLPVCSLELDAAIRLLSFTGARASEVCRSEPKHVNWTAQTILYPQTKSAPRVVALAPIVMAALLPLRHVQGRLCGFNDRWRLNSAIAEACKRAGLPVMSSHQVGRHAFAARLLGQGKTLKEVQEAGGWSPDSLPMLARVYGHMERKAVDAAVRAADADLSKLLNLNPNSRSQST
jgi:integrase